MHGCAVHPIRQHRANGAVVHREQEKRIFILLGLRRGTSFPNSRRRRRLRIYRRRLIGNDHHLGAWIRRAIGTVSAVVVVLIRRIPIAVVAVIPSRVPQERIVITVVAGIIIAAVVSPESAIAAYAPKPSANTSTADASAAKASAASSKSSAASSKSARSCAVEATTTAARSAASAMSASLSEQGNRQQDATNYNRQSSPHGTSISILYSTRRCIWRTSSAPGPRLSCL